jgi:hypothetical protein
MIFKIVVMKHVIKPILASLLFVFFSKAGYTQEYNPFQTSDAVLVKINEGTIIENRVSKVIVALKNHSILNVRMTIPWYSIDNVPEEDSLLESPGVLFNLTMIIGPARLQDYDTSPKMFTTSGLLTLKGITGAVAVEYAPLPHRIDLNDGLNLSITILFNPIDFGLDVSPHDSKLVVLISDARVNRI